MCALNAALRGVFNGWVILIIFCMHAYAETKPVEEVNAMPEDFQITPFSNSESGQLAAYGRSLVVNTYKLIGPNSNQPIIGNKLSCTSCHLKGGTKPFAAPYIGLSNIFPIYIAREDRVVSLEERINGCIERSLNGRTIDHDSYEMRAIVSYIQHLSSEYYSNRRVKGHGFLTLELPNRAANPLSGQRVFERHCVSCHGVDGQGGSVTAEMRIAGKSFPPLWGDGSYNDGAGMARVLTAARYIKANMPLGTKASAPILSDEEAYDVAAYINSHARPVKANKENDYPDLSKKPKDCPYPPYADAIPQSQHKFGPFNFTR